jgi:hypothetical protein
MRKALARSRLQSADNDIVCGGVSVDPILDHAKTVVGYNGMPMSVRELPQYVAETDEEGTPVLVTQRNG